MKKYYLLLLIISAFTYTQAQTINFTDINFENALLAHVPNIDTDFSGTIEVNEALVITDLDVSDRTINSIDGIENFVNLFSFKCNTNFLTSLNGIQSLAGLSTLECHTNQLGNINEAQNLMNLNTIDCSYNYLISSVNLTQLSQLQIFDCSYNAISSIDTSQNPMLWDLNCMQNNLITIDITSNHELAKLNVQSNQLESMFIKNGNEFLVNGGDFYLADNPNLAYICVDDAYVESVATGWAITNNVSPFTYLDRVNSYCTFVPGGGSYVVSGQNTFDSNNDGCDITDPALPHLSFSINNGTATGHFKSNETGDYSIAVPQGVYTITPELNTYFTATPANIVVDFSTAPNPSTQDFCITSNGVYNDLEVSVLPLELARPGFDTTYLITYQNKGTTTLSGDVNLSFNDDLVDYVNATPNVDTINTGELIWNYTNLEPFEKRELFLTVNANTPTDPNFPLNNGDVLNYTATINPVSGDETPEDNVFELHQTVVNSYDPNDKTCLEGTIIEPSEVGEYVHYMIRFENNGTASAVNIVVKDVIDIAKYDVSTLTILKGSHDFVTKIRDTNIVEFIFENINLPFDDANNDGYVSFKIKTLSTLVENDTFENKAEIYFDYNPAIVTNLAQTKIESALGISDYLIDNSITYYPNPAKNTIYINSENNLTSISVYDINGRVLLKNELMENQGQKDFDVSKFNHGVYFIKIVSDKGQHINKLVIE